jgi:hypothetical protein
MKAFKLVLKPALLSALATKIQLTAFKFCSNVDLVGR